MRLTTFVLATFIGVAFAGIAPSLGAQSPSGPPPDFHAYTPRVTAARIAEDDAPDIDGDLSDPAWRDAAVIEEFYTVEPVEGGTPSQPTRAYIMYDARTLYIGVYAYDSTPQNIRRSQLSRDPALGDDDTIRVLIDSYGTFRDGYWFAVNPNGARFDALTENNDLSRNEWNTIWRAKASVVEDGWIAEFAIPFQSFSFDPSLDEWNFQINRIIRRNNEDIRWSNIDQSRRRIDLTNPGRLAGIEDVSTGAGLEVQAFVTGAGSYDWESRNSEFDLDPSANIFYKITPSLTGSLTFNTDFADSPLDSRQVNTGRFSLFFPETRDFFLQDAAVFEFGGRLFSSRRNGLPFFSRNIGIVDGRPVDIIAGAKLSGKAGPANLGLISARTGAQEELGVDGQFLTAARLSMPVLAESKAGVIVTHGDPLGENGNTLAGADFQFKRSNLFGEGTLLADFAYVRSFDEENGSDDAFGADMAYRSQSWNATAHLREIGEDFTPRLGFANRTGIRRYLLDGWRRIRPQNSAIRFVDIGAKADLVTDQDNARLDQFFGAWAEGENHAGDELRLEYEHGFENIREPFDIAGRVAVAPGRYAWDRYIARVEFSNARPVGLEAEIGWGGVYDGDFFNVKAGLNVRPFKHFEIAVDHEYREFALPSGTVGIHIASIESIIAFTPDMNIKTDIQYDNISEGFTFFSRFSWEPVPEREIFFAFGHTALIESEDFPRSFSSRGSSLALRLGHTFRM